MDETAAPFSKGAGAARPTFTLKFGKYFPSGQPAVVRQLHLIYLHARKRSLVVAIERERVRNRSTAHLQTELEPGWPDPRRWWRS